jgi:phospho-N-acetylmuramoyl-pentapeptide-transferase
MSVALGCVLLFAAVLGLTLALGRPLIAFLRRLSFEQRAYEDAPETHAVKTGTPTMGGLLFFIGLLAAAPFAEAASGVGFALLLLGAGCGAVGAVDDLTSIRRGRNRGLRAGPKFALTAVVGVAFLFAIRDKLPPEARDVIFTFGGASLGVPHPVWYALALLALLATTHAVNLTDGLDGLAGGTILPPLAVFAYLGVRMHVAGVTMIDVALAASIIGFLAFNRHPARVFMGDTGALALGGVLAGSAVLTGNVLLLPLVGGVFAAEALSVIVQVAYFKATRKRIFRMSPLHHHFELGGWPETKVTARFWTVSALLSLAGAALAR